MVAMLFHNYPSKVRYLFLVVSILTRHLTGVTFLSVT